MFKQFYKHGLFLCFLLGTQLLMVSVGEAQDSGNNPEPVHVNDDLILIPAPATRMGTPPSVPGISSTSATATEAVLPEVVEIHTRRDAGSQLIANLQTSAISELTIDATRLVPADMGTFALSQDPTEDPFDNLNDGTTFFTTMSVSSDAVRLVAELVETTAVDIQLFVGQGTTPTLDSLVCTGGAAAYCNVPSPAEGDWWILLQNRTGSAVQPDSVTLAHAAVDSYDTRCSQLLECLEEFQACLLNSPFDECWQELLDCLLQFMDAADLEELKACLLEGGGESCFEELLDCFPDWPDSDAAQDDDDEDEECAAAHQYANHHEDDHFMYQEHCNWWSFWLPNMWVEGPDSVGEMEPFDLRVFWDEPAITAGEIWYAAFDVGSGPSQPGDIGTIYIDLNRFEDDVAKLVSAATAVPGDILTYTITIQPNVTPLEPTYLITDTIPPGLSYVPGSATATSGTVAVTDGVLTWTGPVSEPGFTYQIDTSATNPACAAPAASADGVADGYLDLAALGIPPDPIIFGNSVWYQASFAGQFYLFGAPQGNILNFTDDGFVFLSGSGPGPAPQNNLPIPNAADPNNLLAVLWRDMEIVYDGTRGVTLATLVSSSLGKEVGAIIEYDGVQDRVTPGSTATYDFEIIAYYDVDPARYEYVFAYKNIANPVTTGTIGLENAAGTEGIQFAYNGFNLSDGMAICFDQVGNDGETAVEISYQVQVNETAFGILANSVAHITDNPGSKEVHTAVNVYVNNPSLFLSANSDGLAGSIAYADEDIVRYNLDTGEWSLILDGSDVGLNGTDVDALHVQDDGSILLSLAHRLKIPGFGKVDDSDIIRFIPTSLGEDSAGSFEMFFDGSEYGLNRSSEDVDAIGFDGDGRLVVSTTGFFKVPRTSQSPFWCWDDSDETTDAEWFPIYCDQLWGANEDLIALDQDSASWELYFDGSDVVGHEGDLGDVWINPANGDIYLSLDSQFTIDSLSGEARDIFICHPDSLGDDTRCTLAGELFFDGSEAGFSGLNIDGFAIGR